MSDDTPIHTDTVFAAIMEQELRTWEPQSDTEIAVYGCRVLFYQPGNPEAHMSLLIPWLTYDEERAQLRKAEITQRLTGHRLRGFMNYDPTVWTPLAVRVVQLAEIPF